MEFRISLAGDLGSGKSTVANALSKEFNAEIVSAGKIQRELAKSLNLTIEEFNRFMETDKSYDKKLDDFLVSYNDKKGSFIFDSRMSWYFVPTAVSFYLKVAPMEAARRIMLANRADETYESLEDASKKLLSRRASEAKRYKEYYGQDISDMANYKFVIDTTNLTPEEVAKKIVECYLSVVKN